MPVSPETNTRASHQKVVITKQGAEQHPGQSNVQARGTRETATLRPAFGMRFYPIFMHQGAARAAWTSNVKIGEFEGTKSPQEPPPTFSSLYVRLSRIG